MWQEGSPTRRGCSFATATFLGVSGRLKMSTEVAGEVVLCSLPLTLPSQGLDLTETKMTADEHTQEQVRGVCRDVTAPRVRLSHGHW